MRFLNLLPLCVAVTALNVGFSADAAPFEIEENFDDSSLFPDESSLPDGWVDASTNAWVKFKRWSSMDTGQPTYSGSYMIGKTNANHDDTFYTRLMDCAAGEPVTIEFMARTLGRTFQADVTPGLRVYAGSVQDITQMTKIAETEQAQISEWKKFEYSYTPEADGPVCFAVQVWHAGNMDQLGHTWFDDFYFTGTSPEEPQPELEPNPDNAADCVELPYLEEFEGDNYDGFTYVPIKWLTVGDVIWRTGYMDALKAKSGTYYLVAPDSDTDRNQRLYTPFFNLEKDVEYTMTFHTHFEGTYLASTGEWNSPTMNVTVGTEQDGDFHPVTLATISRDLDEENQWNAESISFTPTVSGPYCFCFKVDGAPYSGYIAMDDFYISSPNDIPRPVADFNLIGSFNWIDSKVMTTESTPIRLLDNSRNADETTWELGDLEHNILPDGNVDVFFPSSGTHSLKLTATNQKGSRSSIKEYDVTVINEDLTFIPMLSYNPGAVTYVERGHIPCFDTDENGLDYVSGFNHYYRHMAEKYILPQDADFTVTDLSFFLTNIRYVPIQDDTKLQQDEPFSISLYGADDEGNLDENKLLGRHTTTMNEVFLSAGIGSMAEPRSVKFDTPVKASGTVYVAFEFSDGMQIDVEDPFVGRSYLSLGMVRNQHGQTSLFGKVTAAPEGVAITPDGSWYPVDALNNSNKGLGLNLQLWANVTRDRSSVALNTLGQTVFGLKSDNGLLTVSGTTEGEYVVVYDPSGRQVAISKAAGESTTIDLTSLAKGTYIVTTNAGSAKFTR